VWVQARSTAPVPSSNFCAHYVRVPGMPWMHVLTFSLARRDLTRVWAIMDLVLAWLEAILTQSYITCCFSLWYFFQIICHSHFLKACMFFLSFRLVFYTLQQLNWDERTTGVANNRSRTRRATNMCIAVKSITTKKRSIITSCIHYRLVIPVDTNNILLLVAILRRLILKIGVLFSIGLLSGSTPILW
jgi:hypothetical protein